MPASTEALSGALITNGATGKRIVAFSSSVGLYAFKYEIACKFCFTVYGEERLGAVPDPGHVPGHALVAALVTLLRRGQHEVVTPRRGRGLQLQRRAVLAPLHLRRRVSGRRAAGEPHLLASRHPGVQRLRGERGLQSCNKGVQSVSAHLYSAAASNLPVQRLQTGGRWEAD